MATLTRSTALVRPAIDWLALGLPALTIGVLGVLASVAARRLAVHFDEGYNLNLVLTLVETGRYATRLGAAMRPFDPAITTGPTALLPLAPVVAVLGPSLETVRAFQTGSFLFYTTIIFLGARTLSGWVPALGATVVVATMPIVPEVSLSALGEYPAVALMVAATAMVALAERAGARAGRGWLMGAGLVLGLAVLAKEIVLLYVLALGAVAGVAAVRLRAPGYLLAPATAIALAASWRALQFVALQLGDPRGYAAWQRDLAERSPTLFSDIAWMPLSHLAETLRLATTLFWPHLLALGLAVAVALAVALTPRRGAASGRSSDVARWTITLGSLSWIGWFIFFSGPQAGDRHFVIGVALSQVAVAATIGRLFESLRVATVPALSACVALWAGLGLLHGLAWNQHELRGSERKLAAQQAVAGWARQHVPPDQPLSGWSWHIPWEVAYLAERRPASTDRGSPTLEGLSDWFVVSPTLAETRARDRRLDGFLDRQGEPVVSQDGYALYRVQWRPGRS